MGPTGTMWTGVELPQWWDRSPGGGGGKVRAIGTRPGRHVPGSCSSPTAIGGQCRTHGTAGGGVFWTGPAVLGSVRRGPGSPGVAATKEEMEGRFRRR